jgi:hypothetical protein
MDQSRWGDSDTNDLEPSFGFLPEGVQDDDELDAAPELDAPLIARTAAERRDARDFEDQGHVTAAHAPIPARVARMGLNDDEMRVLLAIAARDVFGSGYPCCRVRRSILSRVTGLNRKVLNWVIRRLVAAGLVEVIPPDHAKGRAGLSIVWHPVEDADIMRRANPGMRLN